MRGAVAGEIIGPRHRWKRRRQPERTTADLPAQALPDDEDVTAEKKPPDEMHCSFCGKLKTDVAQLVAGPTVYICNECVELCEDIIAEELDSDPPRRDGGDGRRGATPWRAAW